MNSGHVRKKLVAGKPRWYVVVEVPSHEAGKRKQKSLGGYARKADADKALREALTRHEEGSYVEPSKLTLGRYITDLWLPTQKAALRPSTFDSYERQLAMHVVPRLGHLPLQGLNPAHLDLLYADLLAGGRRDGQGGLSVRTVAYIHVILHKLLKAAVRKKLLTANPADAAEPPRQRAAGNADMVVWSSEQLQGFLTHAEGDRLHPAFLLAATTGLRRGEVLGLRWQDVDLEASRMHVRQTLVVVSHALVFSSPKTARGVRTIDLDPKTVAVLRAWRRVQLEERLAWGPGYQELGLVFTREGGSPVHPTGFANVFERLVRSSGLPRLTVHGLRHTFASLALEAGVHPKKVQEILGHSSISVTMDTYSHLLRSSADGTTSVVAALIFGSGR